MPADGYAKYATVLAGIKEQLRLDKIQAEKDQVQAQKDQQQANRDQEQAKKDQQQAEKDQQQAEQDQKQANRDQEQAQKDQLQAMKDQEQAKMDEKQAEEDQRMVKEMIGDLVKDGIAPDEKSVHDVTFNETEMTVNGVKQPDTVFARYKQKYSKLALNHLSYGNNGDGSVGIHMGSKQ